MYAGDPTLSTAKTMMAGALAFAPFLERHLGQSAHSFSVSVPATYIVHRDSQHSAEDVCAYLRTVHALINEAAEGRTQAYFGKDLRAPLRSWSTAEKAAEFDPEIALAAISTPEIAINPVALARPYGNASPPIRLSKCAVAARLLGRRRSATESVS